MTTVQTCLWFDGRIDEAAEFYVSLIPGSQILSRSEYNAADGPPGGPDLTGEALTVEIELGGVPYILLNGGPLFPLTEAVSISLTVEDQAEVDRLWEALIADGGRSRSAGGAGIASACPGRWSRGVCWSRCTASTPSR